MSIEITRIGKNSILRQYNILKGDTIVSINERDIWNYEGVVFESSLDMMILRIRKRNSITVEIPLRREQYEHIDAEFDEEPMMECANNCIFCFVRQNPPHMRKSLYVRDDDYRLSLQYGNFVTLSNLRDHHIRDIIEHQLSPIYISLHSSEECIRERLFGRPMPMDKINMLAENGIGIHAQIVLVRGINDGQHLIKTMEYVRDKQFLSTGIVPCGLTGYREHLPQIEYMDAEYCAHIIEGIEEWKNNNGFSRIYLADEFFLNSGLDIPGNEYYDDFPQIDNGIGMVRQFINETASFNRKLLMDDYCILTGALFGNYLIRNGYFKNNVFISKNDFFKGRVNVAGLLTGSDIISSLTKIPHTHIILYHSIFNEGRTLDDMSKNEIEIETGKKLHIIHQYTELEHFTKCQ